MKKIHVLGLMLVAVFAFSAFAASSAFAVSKILFNGAEITANLGAEILGSLLLQDLNAPGTPDILCTGIFDGTIEAGGELGLVEALLMEGGELLNENGELNGAGNDMIDCVSDNGTCSGEVLVTVLNLPWHIEVVLDATKEAFLADFLEEVGKIPTYDINCNTILGLIEDSCSGLSSARLQNTAGGLLGHFNALPLSSADEWAAESEGTACSVGGAGQGDVQSVTLSAEPTEDLEEFGGLIEPVGGGTFSVSP
jgi:hypothetical protein